MLGEQIATAMERLNLPPIGGGAIGMFVVLGFALGIAMIWLYAAIRPRFGAGVRTALCAGAAVWFFAYLYPNIGLGALGFFPARPSPGGGSEFLTAQRQGRRWRKTRR